MSNILICDGSNLFIRAFFSMTDETLQNSKGQDTTAIYVFLKHFRKLVATEQPEQVYVVFDFGRDARKKALYKGYKANRDIDMSNLAGYDLTLKMNEIESRKRQRDIIIDILKTLPVRTIIVKQVEGDNLMAYAVNYFINLNKTVTIVSNDQDFYQLLGNENIKIFNPHKKEYVDKNNVEEKFPKKIPGIVPLKSFRLFKAITGDSSDNIKGIPLFKEKKFKELFDIIKESGTELPATIDELYACFNNIIATHKFWKYFSENRKLIETNWKLMDLIDMDFSPQTLSIIYQALEMKVKYNKIDFMQLLIKENIITISSKVDSFVEPFNNLLPKG